MKLFEQVLWRAKLLGLHWYHSSWLVISMFWLAWFPFSLWYFLLSILSPSSCTKCQESCLADLFNHARVVPFRFCIPFLVLAWVRRWIGYRLRWHIRLKTWRDSRKESVDRFRLFQTDAHSNSIFRRAEAGISGKSDRLILSNFQILTHLASMAQRLISDGINITAAQSCLIAIITNVHDDSYCHENHRKITAVKSKMWGVFICFISVSEIC